uniref:Uncharacterized protein n=1 Tax=Naja naja TaxID=35670 RepID=A0A8C6VHA7_NAJNA
MIAFPTYTALFLQSWWRGTLVRRSLFFATLCAVSIQRWWRQRVFQLKEERRVRALMMYVWPEKSTVLLQSKLRMWLIKTQFKKYQKAAQVIQKNWRNYTRGHLYVLFAATVARRVQNSGLPWV